MQAHGSMGRQSFFKELTLPFVQRNRIRAGCDSFPREPGHQGRLVDVLASKFLVGDDFAQPIAQTW
jgi:hypothetical protein